MSEPPRIPRRRCFFVFYRAFPLFKFCNRPIKAWSPRAFPIDVWMELLIYHMCLPISPQSLQVYPIQTYANKKGSITAGQCPSRTQTEDLDSQCCGYANVVSITCIVIQGRVFFTISSNVWLAYINSCKKVLLVCSSFTILPSSRSPIKLL